VALTPDGYVLTSAHVVRGEKPRVRLSATSALPAEVVGSDRRTDLALLHVEASGLTTLPLAADHLLEVGQLVLAIGNPLGFDRSVSLGVVSALDRELASRAGVLEGLVQTDAAVNPGSSGGPLLDMEGRVVGINAAVVAPGRGLGFAVPARTASWIAAVLLRSGEVRRPYLGIAARSETLPPMQAQSIGRARAVRVLRVESDTPAADGGLLAADLLLAANEQPVTNLDDLSRVMVLSGAPALELDVLRERGRRRIQVRPRARAA
jgi:S1-C subfamily serine protease